RLPRHARRVAVTPAAACETFVAHDALTRNPRRRPPPTRSTRLSPEWRCGSRRDAVTRRPLVSVGEGDQRRLAVGPTEEGEADRQSDWRETRGHDDRGGVDQKRVQVRRTLVVDVRRIKALTNQRRRVLHRLVHDRVETMI